MILSTGGLDSIGSRTQGQHIHSTRHEDRGGIVNTTVTDEQIRQLAEMARPYRLALLWWDPEQHMDGARDGHLDDLAGPGRPHPLLAAGEVDAAVDVGPAGTGDGGLQIVLDA